MEGRGVHTGGMPRSLRAFPAPREPPSTAVQHFTFALTDLAGTRRFGFCRLRAGALSCLCILRCGRWGSGVGVGASTQGHSMETVSTLHSHLPWFEVFYKLLNTVGDLLAQDQVRPTLPVISAGVPAAPHPPPPKPSASQA